MPNQPLEWTGRQQCSAPPPQAHCLPLRGSVSSPANLPCHPRCYADRVTIYDKEKVVVPQSGYKWRVVLGYLKLLAS